MQINNIAVVRFSLRMKASWEVKAFEDESGRESWFKMRAAIFKSTLHSCLLNQTTAPIAVFILMDKLDRDLFNKYLNLQEPFYVPIYSEGSDGYDQVKAKIHAFDVPNLAISRIDSDDYISNDYFSNINDLIALNIRKGVDFKYIIAARGYRSDLKSIHQIFYNYGPFATIYLSTYGGENIYETTHAKIIKQSCLICVEPMWIQLIHGTNVNNKLYEVSSFEKFFKINPLVDLVKFNKLCGKYAGTKQKKKFFSVAANVETDWPQGFVSTQ